MTKNIERSKGTSSVIPPNVQDAEVVGAVDLTPNMQPKLYFQIIFANMEYVIKNFPSAWKKARSRGYDVENIRAFLQEWYELFEADLYMVDSIEARTGHERGKIPGVYTMVRSLSGIQILVRGQPISDILAANIRVKFEDARTNGLNDKETAEKVSQFLRNWDYDVISWQDFEGGN